MNARLDRLLDDFGEYFVSVYHNSVRDLLLFLAAMMLLFVGRHLWINYRMRQVRHALPAVIGGWGTRGKSGTERLKAALVNALGYGVASKTTGCEAMLLHCHPYGRLREMFLFRPYDKATIWEQVNVARQAGAMGSDIFLWECMGLNPDYVDVLQHQWMRDDISTITNAYPDHEDIQGPAGYNVAEVIAQFIPRSATVLTTEEQMLPILRAEAQRLGTQLRSVGWRQTRLLAPDVLARFPYEEHPSNIALVLALAEELGIDGDYALKEMADRLVPDLGALRAYPTALVDGRYLEFVNGMSANERLGTLGNWERMGFRRHDPEQEPGVFLSTVVNNRADRVARSRVFAGVIVGDLHADCHILIGSNLDGLQSMIRSEWDELMRTVSLWAQADPALPSDPDAIFHQWLRRLRIPASVAALQRRLRAMLAGLCPALSEAELAQRVALWADPAALRAALPRELAAERVAELLQHLGRYADEQAAAAAFAARLPGVGSAPDPALDHELHQLLWQWFSRRLVVIPDVHASGDQIVRKVCEETPPGYRNRVMGVQNIKGTGLNWVYAWQDWAECAAYAAALESPQPQIAEQGLRGLAEVHRFNLLARDTLRLLLARMQLNPMAQSELFQTELAAIQARLDRDAEALAQQHPRSRWEPLVHGVEAFLDAGDAVRRRKQGNLVYRELAAGRISHGRAAAELLALNRRQKGGWLMQRLRTLMKPLSAEAEGETAPELS